VVAGGRAPFTYLAWAVAGGWALCTRLAR
jgi:hypothetical protein